MKSLLSLLGVLGVVLLVTGAVAQDSAPSGPRIALSQTFWDFGEVWHQEKPTFMLTVKNEGDAPLLIKDVRTTCGCTAAQPSRREIPPGETAEIKVQYDTEGKQGDQDSKVLIYTNDPRQLGHEPGQKPGEAHFLVKGFVKRAITKTPLGGLAIRSLDPRPGQTGVVRLENQMPEPMQLKLLSNNIRELEVEIKEVKPGMVYDIVGRTKQEMKRGILRGKLEFSTGLAKEPRFIVHTQVRIFNILEPVPAAMLLEKDDTPVQRVVSLHYFGEGGPEKFKVTGVECPNKEVRVTYGDTLPAEPWMKTMTPPITAHVQAQVFLPPGNKLPPEGVRITFSTSLQECPQVEVLATTDKGAFERIMYGPEGSAGVGK